MEITLIGKWGAYPEANSANVAFLIEEKDFRLLVDCGSGVLAALFNYINPIDLDGVLLSHYHHDHKADVGALQYFTLIQTQLGNRSEPLKIYGHTEDKQEFEALTFLSYTVGEEIKVGRKKVIGPFEIEFLPTVHPVYCLAMKFKVGGKAFVYSADTEWTDDLVSFAEGADIFLCEASLYNQQKGKVQGHLTAGEVGEIAKRASVKKLILTHLPHYGEHQQLVEEAKENYSGDVILAEEGMILTIR